MFELNKFISRANSFSIIPWTINYRSCYFNDSICSKGLNVVRCDLAVAKKSCRGRPRQRRLACSPWMIVWEQCPTSCSLNTAHSIHAPPDRLTASRIYTCTRGRELPRILPYAPRTCIHVWEIAPRITHTRACLPCTLPSESSWTRSKFPASPIAEESRLEVERSNAPTSRRLFTNCLSIA